MHELHHQVNRNWHPSSILNCCFLLSFNIFVFCSEDGCQLSWILTLLNFLPQTAYCTHSELRLGVCTSCQNADLVTDPLLPNWQHTKHDTTKGVMPSNVCSQSGDSITYHLACGGSLQFAGVSGSGIVGNLSPQGTKITDNA